MKEISYGHLYLKLRDRKEQMPVSGQIELTYRCNLDCVQCYCDGMEYGGSRSQVVGNRYQVEELKIKEWKRILDEIHKEGCLFITFTGGDPLVREDFIELYSYAKEKGFVISIFTNAYGFSDETIDYLVK